MLPGEELDITQIPMYLSPLKKLHEAILFRCRYKQRSASEKGAAGRMQEVLHEDILQLLCSESASTSERLLTDDRPS